MNVLRKFKNAIIIGILFTTSISAAAGYFNNRMMVQGYLKQGTTALNDTSGYLMKFTVKQNGTAVWCQISAAFVPVVSGLFNTVLSGAANCSSLSNSLDATTFNHAANSDTFTIDVVVDVSKDGFGGADDATFSGIDLVSSPLAIMCSQANNALFATNATNAVNATSATSATTATTATNVSGTVAIANGGTGATSVSAARSALGLGSVALIDTSGVSTQYLKGDGTWAAISALVPSNNLSDIGNASTARTNIAAAGSGANTDITSLSQAITLSAAGTALTVTNNASVGGSVSANTLTTVGNGTIGGALSVTGNATVSGGTINGPASATLTMQSSSNQNLTLSAQGTGVATLQGGTVKIGSTGSALSTGILAGSATGLNLSASATQTVTVTNAAVGDAVSCGFSTATALTTAAYWMITGTVTAANTVTAVVIRTGTPPNITKISCHIIK